MNPNEALEIVKAQMANDSQLSIAVSLAYGRVCDSIEARALAKRPLPPVFEVRHETVTARAALFLSLAAGDDVGVAELKARESVGF